MAGAVNIGDIEARLKLNDELTAQFRRTVEGIQQRVTQIETQTKRASKGFREIQGSITDLAGVGGAAAQRLAGDIAGLSDRFSSLATAAVELGPLAPVIMGVAAAVGALTLAWQGLKFVQSAVVEGMEIQQTIAQLEASLRSNGAAAGYSSNELLKLADSFVHVSGVEDEIIAKGLIVFTRFHDLGHDALPRATKAALDYARASGENIPAAFEKIAKVLTDTAGLRAFKDFGLVFTASQKQTLTALLETGKEAEYQAIIFKALEQSLNDSAEAYAKTLAGSIDIARAELGEFREGIASEVIPALETVVDQLVESAGGWDYLHRLIAFVSHEMGNDIRQMVLGILLSYHQWEAQQAAHFHNLIVNFRGFVNTILEIGIQVNDAMSSLPAILGGGQRAQDAANLRKIQSETNAYLDNAAKKSQETAMRHGRAIQGIIAATVEHRQALEGSDVVHEKHKNVLDEVAGKTDALAGKVNDLTEKYRQSVAAAEARAKAERIGGSVLRDVIEQYQIKTRLLADINALEGLSATAKARLRAALESLLQQEKLWERQADANKTLRAEEISLDNDRRLSAIRLKEAMSGSTAATRLEAAAIEAERKATSLGLEKNTLFVYVLTRLLALRKELAITTERGLATIKRDAEYSTQLRTAQAQLADAISGTTDASRELAIQLEIEQRIIADGVKGNQAAIDKIKAEVRERRSAISAITDQTKAARTLQQILSDAKFEIQVSQLGFDPSGIETRWLEILREMGEGSVEVGRQVFEGLARELGITVDQIKDALQTISDAEIARNVKGAGVSPLEAYRIERANIERLMKSSVDSVRISTEDGLAYINRITEEFWSTQIGNWSSVISSLADTFGGVFESLAQGAKIIEDAYNTYTLIKNAVTSAGGSENWGQTFGEIGAWLQIIKGIYDVWKGHKARREGRVFENDQPIIRMQGGMWNDGPLSDGWAGTFTNQLSQRSYDIARKIQQTADAFAESIGGTLASFTDLEIKIRRDGEKIRAYVAGAFVGEFNEIEEAISAAMAVAFADPKTTFRGLTELVQQALDQVVKNVNIGGIGGSAEAMQDWLVQIREVAQIQWSQAAVGAGDTVRHLESLWKALAKVTNVTPAVVQGFQDLATSEIRAFQDWADSISGRERTNAEILADKERDRDLFIAQRALRIAELELRKIELQQLRAGVQSRANIDAAGGRLDNIRIQWRQGVLDAEGNLFEYEAGLRDASLRGEWGYATARAEIIGAEISLTQQYTDAVAAQIAAIDAILAGLAAIPIPEIGLGRGGSSTGRNIADERRDFRDSLRDIIGSLLPDIEADFYSLQQRIRDLQEEARRLKIPVSELAPALAALRREFQEGLLARANDLAGIGTGFTARLQEGLDFFRSLEALGRANTGIPDWMREILEGRFLEQMRADWQGRVDSFRGLENPMLEIQARAYELQQDLLALAAATGMTAEQIAAAQAQIAEGIEFQRLSAVNGLLDRVFGYLRTSADFADETMAFERAKIEAEFRLMEAQFRFLGAWDETTAAWLSAAREIALTQLEAPIEEITTAASGLTDAANAQKSVIDRWRSAIDSWNQYRESLRNDSSLGMVNSREALNNTRALYESLRDRALGGDVEAAERLTQAAEDYRRNLIAFSPSSELVSSVLRGMDALNLDNLAPRVDPVVSGLSSVYTAITTQTTEWANHFANQTANDNTWTNHIADTTATHLTLVQDKQQRTTDEIVGLRGDVRDLNSNILSWRSESRETSGNLLGVEKEIRDETQRMIANMARVVPLAATPK